MNNRRGHAGCDGAAAIRPMKWTKCQGRARSLAVLSETRGGVTSTASGSWKTITPSLIRSASPEGTMADTRTTILFVTIDRPEDIEIIRLNLPR